MHCTSEQKTGSMSSNHWSEVDPWNKKQHSQKAEEIAELLAKGQSDEALLQITRNRLYQYAKVRRELDVKGRPIDDILWKKLRTAILPHTYWRFRERFGLWFQNVEYVINPCLPDLLSTEIRRWERKITYEKYKEDGKRRGLWGSPFGEVIARFFPSTVYVISADCVFLSSI